MLTIQSPLHMCAPLIRIKPLFFYLPCFENSLVSVPHVPDVLQRILYCSISSYGIAIRYKIIQRYRRESKRKIWRMGCHSRCD